MANVFCGLDFGTTNSSIALSDGSHVRVLEVDADLYKNVNGSNDEWEKIGPLKSDETHTIDSTGESDIELDFTIDNVVEPLGDARLKVEGIATLQVLNLIQFDKDISRIEDAPYN